MSNRQSKHLKIKSLGFSLLEVLVSITIITIITATVLAQYSGFDSTTLLRNQAYDIALSIREAQVLGVSVRGRDAQFRTEYGIYVDSTTNQYILFFDEDFSSNPTYNSNDPTKTIRSTALDPRFEIYDLIAGGSSGQDNVTIGFQRPNFDAILLNDSGDTVNEVEIVIASKRSGETFSVYVNSVGRIRVGSSSP